MKLARLGEQIGLCENAQEKAVPVAASASRFGVLTNGFPKQPNVSHRCRSVQIQRILGRVTKRTLLKMWCDHERCIIFTQYRWTGKKACQGHTRGAGIEGQVLLDAKTLTAYSVCRAKGDCELCLWGPSIIS